MPKLQGFLLKMGGHFEAAFQIATIFETAHVESALLLPTFPAKSIFAEGPSKTTYLEVPKLRVPLDHPFS